MLVKKIENPYPSLSLPVLPFPSSFSSFQNRLELVWWLWWSKLGVTNLDGRLSPGRLWVPNQRFLGGHLWGGSAGDGFGEW